MKKNVLSFLSSSKKEIRGDGPKSQIKPKQKHQTHLLSYKMSIHFFLKMKCEVEKKMESVSGVQDKGDSQLGKQSPEI